MTEEECKHNTIKRIVNDNVVEVFKRDDKGELQQTETYREWVNNDIIEEFCMDCDVTIKDLQAVDYDEDDDYYD